MDSTATLLPEGERRGEQAHKLLMEAYRSVFLDGGSHGAVVLADLADYCGWNKIAPINAGLEGHVDHNARRACFGRIFHFLNLTAEERKGLDEAARRESLANREGII